MSDRGDISRIVEVMRDLGCSDRVRDAMLIRTPSLSWCENCDAWTEARSEWPECDERCPACGIVVDLDRAVPDEAVDAALRLLIKGKP
jgi:hypothetical protein